MKILFYLHHFPGVGGIERITSQLATIFATELGHDVGIFSHTAKLADRVPNPDGARFIRVAAENPSVPAERQLAETLADFKPDVVIYQDSYAPVEDMLLQCKSSEGFRLIVCEHNTPDSYLRSYRQRWSKHSWLNPKGFVKKLAYPIVWRQINSSSKSRHRKLVDAADRYVVLSESYMDIMGDRWGIKSPKLSAIPNIKYDFGATPEEVHSEKGKEVLFVGRLTEDKGIWRLIDIWERIEAAHPDWTLRIAGTGEEQERLEEEIKRRGLRSVRLEGYVKDIAALYRSASLLFMTSSFEGFPLVLAEAMEFGVIPVVYDSFSAARDMVEDGENGFLVKPFDRQMFVDRFNRLASMNYDELERMRSNARQKSSRFSKENVIGKWIGLLSFENAEKS